MDSCVPVFTSSTSPLNEVLTKADDRIKKKTIAAKYNISAITENMMSIRSFLTNSTGIISNETETVETKKHK